MLLSKPKQTGFISSKEGKLFSLYDVTIPDEVKFLVFFQDIIYGHSPLDVLKYVSENKFFSTRSGMVYLSKNLCHFLIARPLCFSNLIEIYDSLCSQPDFGAKFREIFVKSLAIGFEIRMISYLFYTDRIEESLVPRLEDEAIIQAYFPTLAKGKKAQMMTESFNSKGFAECIFNGWEKNSLGYIIKFDLVDVLQEYSSVPGFKWNEVIKSGFYEKIPESMSLLTLAAYYGSEKCFSLILLNSEIDEDVKKYSIIGGNISIVRQIEQITNSIPLYLTECMLYNHNDLFGWMVENKVCDSIFSTNLSISSNLRGFFFIIENSTNQYLRSRLGSTLFKSSVENGAIPVLEFLLKYGFNTEHCGLLFNSLVKAVMHSNDEMIQFLLSKGIDIGISPEMQNRFHQGFGSKEEYLSIDHCAIKYNSINILKILLDNRWNRKRNYKDEDLFRYAIECKKSEVIKFLFEMNIPIKFSVIAHGLFHSAIDTNDIDFLNKVLSKSNTFCYQKLLRQAFYFSSKNSLLQLSIKKGNIDIIKMLESHGFSYLSDSSIMFSSLLEAIISGHFHIIEHFVSKGCNVNVHSDSYETPIFVAIKRCKSRIVEFLVKNGANINITNSNMITPLHLASSTKDNIVQFLIKSGAKVNVYDKEMRTPLFMSMKSNSKENSLFLVTNGAKCNEKDIHGISPMYFAIKNGNMDNVKLLLENGFDINTQIKSSRDSLFYAHIKGNYDIAMYLISKGANLNAYLDSYGSYLAIPTSIMNIDYFSSILDQSRDIINHPNSNNQTPLKTAIESENLSLVTLYLSKGADVNQLDMKLDSPLKIAIEQGNNDVIRLLIQSGANPNTPNLLGITPFHIACGSCDSSIIDLLTDQGADPNLLDCNQHSPLYHAVKSLNMNAVRSLISRGANVNAKVNIYGSYLHLAAKKQSLDLCTVFIQNGIHVNILNSDGMSPIYYAEKPELIQYFISQNAKIDGSINPNSLTPLHFYILDNDDKADIPKAYLGLKASTAVDLYPDLPSCTPIKLAQYLGKKQMVSVLNKT